MSDATTNAATGVIAKALNHVREHYPNVTQVEFRSEGDHDIWEYSDGEGEAPTFGPEIDVGVLEDAIDAAYSGARWPAIYLL